jgi:RND family efflux transporter MFP subunit
MMRKLVIPALVVIASIFGAVTLLATSPKLTPSVPAPIPTTVRVVDVALEPVLMKVNSQGTVAPSTESDLIPEVSGRVVWISPSLVAGGSFSKGDALLRLEDKDYRANVERARAGITRTEAEHEHAKFEYARLKSLEARQLVSRSQLENALRAERVAEAALRDARSALEQAERDLTRTELSAPFTGLVRTRQVDYGQFVSRGAPIARVYATDFVEVRLPIADRQLQYLDLPPGQLGEVPADAQPNVLLRADYAGRRLTWTGRIVRTEAEIDVRSRMVHVVARVENDAQETPLSVGLFVEAEIEGRLAEGVVVLPRTALREGNRVLVVDADNRMRYRAVAPLRFHGDEVLIQSGLEAGERVCISPVQTVIDGMPVTPVRDDAVGTTAARGRLEQSQPAVGTHSVPAA